MAPKTIRTEIMPATNSTYTQVAVQWLNQALCFYQSLCSVDSISLRNRHLRVAAKRSEEIPSGFPRYGSGLHTSSTALRDCPRTWVSRKRETCVKPRAVVSNLRNEKTDNNWNNIFDPFFLSIFKPIEFGQLSDRKN